MTDKIHITIRKPKPNTILASLVTLGVVTAGATFGLTSLGDVQVAEAQQASPGTKIRSRKQVSEVVRSINKPNSEVGMVVLLSYDGTIETVAVNRSGSETVNYDAPPAGSTKLGEQLDVDFEIYQTNPNCITCKHGGSYYTICR